jgi:hypothetical protein
MYNEIPEEIRDIFEKNTNRRHRIYLLAERGWTKPELADKCLERIAILTRHSFTTASIDRETLAECWDEKANSFTNEQMQEVARRIADDIAETQADLIYEVCEEIYGDTEVFYTAEHRTSTAAAGHVFSTAEEAEEWIHNNIHSTLWQEWYVSEHERAEDEEVL